MFNCFPTDSNVYSYCLWRKNLITSVTRRNCEGISLCITSSPGWVGFQRHTKFYRSFLPISYLGIQLCNNKQLVSFLVGQWNSSTDITPHNFLILLVRLRILLSSRMLPFIIFSSSVQDRLQHIMRCLLWQHYAACTIFTSLLLFPCFSDKHLLLIIQILISNFVVLAWSGSESWWTVARIWTEH